MLRSKKKRLSKKSNNRARGVRSVESLEDRQMMAGHTAADCIDFEDLAVGDTFVVGDSFVADNVDFQADIVARPFQWSNGVMTAAGQATVEGGNSSGHIGQDIAVNNINLDFSFSDKPVDDLTMHFGEYGGNLNLMVNGDFVNFENFQDINGAVIGGNTINVVNGSGQDAGVLQVIGPVHEFAVGGQELWIDHVCRGLGDDNPQGEFDFGDAPDRPYPTLIASNGAAHVIDPDVFLGRTVDPEADGQPSLNADRDDLNPAFDDEDGVRFLTPVVPGGVAQVEVIASTDGFLNAWIDFDRDGVWTNGGPENVFSAHPVNAGVNILAFNVPADAKPAPNDPTYSRWRFSTTHKLLNPDATIPKEEVDRVPNGEVEDHLVFIERDPEPVERYDFGDAPERPYPVTRGNGGAVHEINPDVFLGRTVDPETDGQPSPDALGDDMNPAFDDEDGVRFLTPLVPGQQADVEVIASADGWLNAWIDFDRDGSWTPGTSDEIFVGEPLAAGVNVISFNVPADAKPGPNEPTFSRWRFSTTDRVLTPKEGSPTGATPDGEVEDHMVFIQDAPQPELDFGDAPERPYPVTLANSGAYHEINPDVFLGRTVDPEPDGQPSPNANRDDLNPAFDDEDGVRFLTPLIPGQAARVEVIASADGWLNAWIDFHGDGDWTPGSSDEIFLAQPLVAGVNVLSFNVPADAKPGPNEPTFSRWRFSTTDRVLTPKGGDLAGNTPDGEVEDHIAFIQDAPQPELDFGDAPERPYPVTLANSGAFHEIDPDVFLGRTVDAEPDGQPSPAANRDDINSVTDDEDGVRFLTPLVPGQPAEVEVIASTDGFLNAWIDFHSNGDWAPGTSDEIFFAQPVVAGVNVLSFNVPADAKPTENEPTFSRWRFSTTDKELTQKGGNLEGNTPNGEVEDHILRIADKPDTLDFGDAPERPYPVTLANGGAYHEVDPDVFLGRTVDAEPDGQPSPAANRDDINSVTDDEDGVRFLTPLVPGQPAEVEVIASTDGFLNAWIDFHSNGDWAPGTSDEIFFAEPVVAGVNVLSFNVPADAKPTENEPTFSRWRFSTTDKELTPEGGNLEGNTPNGEVEDHILRISDRPVEETMDFGDLRDSYGTTLANNGARHVINPDIFLGRSIDAEPDGQPSFDGKRDDSVLLDDEDGVHFATAMVPGGVSVVDVVSSANARLDAWADFNQNGTFDAGEQIINSVPVSPGANSIRYVVPDGAIPHPTRPVATRFRLSTNGGLSPVGPARDGEVEDYVTMNGDVNGDLSIDVNDIDGLCGLIHNGDASGDLNNDGVVDSGDRDYLVHNIIGTHYGDANLDLVFDSKDLIQMFVAGEYEDGIPGNSTWGEGDFNCDGEFDSGDLVEAFKDGAYSAAAVAKVGAAVDQPATDSDSSDEADAEADEAKDTETRSQRRDLHAIAIDELFGDDTEDRDKNHNLSQDARDRVFEVI